MISVTTRSTYYTVHRACTLQYIGILYKVAYSCIIIYFLYLFIFQFGSPVYLRVFGGTNILANVIPRTDNENEEGLISAAFDLSFGELKFARDLSQLYSLVNQMYQRGKSFNIRCRTIVL